MRIGFITTLQTNVGDDFVREGIRAVLDALCSYQPYLINKHQPEATCLGSVPEDAPNPVGDKILGVDMVIQCGAPVYWNLGPHPGQKCSNAEWIEALWYDRIAKIHASRPVLNLAAGACQGYFGSAREITEDSECRAFIRDIYGFCRLTTVRDRMAYDVHTSLGLPVDLRPCSSIFAWRRCWPNAGNTGKAEARPIALNFMRLAGHYDIESRICEGEWKTQFREIAALLRKAGEEVLPVAHNPEEGRLLEQLLPGHRVFYSPNYLDYFPVYARCKGGIFNRVHGALLLAGRGVPSVVIGNDSRAWMADEFALPRWHVSEVQPKVVVSRLLEMAYDSRERDRLLEIEQRAFGLLSGQVREVLAIERPARLSAVPQRQAVLIAQSGGVGDLVLLSQTVHSIKRAHPEWDVTLACSSRLMGVVSLFPVPPDEVVPIECNPYRWSGPCPELLDELRPLVESLRVRDVDIYLSAELRPTWFSWLLASILRPREALSCTSIDPPEGFLSRLRDELGLKPWAMRRISPPEGIHELRRYELLLEALNIATQPSFPWPRGKNSRQSEYLVCFPSGSPGTRVKRWPMENFAAALTAFRARWQLPVVLLGHTSEREDLLDLAGKIGGADIVAGDDLTVAADVVANARVYLGNDTGPMHLAAAFGVAGVAIYGGGHWPSYAPWGPGSIGLVNPLPCFGCDWDCVFGQGVCVESISVDDVHRAIDEIMTAPPQNAESRLLNRVEPKLQQIIQGAASKHRLLQSDRAARLAALEQATAAIRQQQLRLSSLEATTSERLSALQEKEAVITELHAAATERLTALQKTEAALVELRAELQRTRTELTKRTRQVKARSLRRYLYRRFRRKGKP